MHMHNTAYIHVHVDVDALRLILRNIYCTTPFVHVINFGLRRGGGGGGVGNGWGALYT